MRLERTIDKSNATAILALDDLIITDYEKEIDNEKTSTTLIKETTPIQTIHTSQEKTMMESVQSETTEETAEMPTIEITTTLFPYPKNLSCDFDEATNKTGCDGEFNISAPKQLAGVFNQVKVNFE